MTTTPPSTTSQYLAKIPLWVFAVVVPLLALIVIASRGFGADGTATGDAGQTTARTVAIVDFAYQPETISVGTGVAITVVNRDDAAHTITANDGTFDTGELGRDERTTITVDRPGTYRYFCDIHQYMQGTLRVT